MQSINPLNVLLPEDDDDNEPICVICQENLNEHATYKLPECNHEFHTHCIVTWFRHYNFAESQSDGRCPCCGNTGINNLSNNKKWHNGWRYSFAEKMKLKFILKEAKKTNAPKLLITSVNNYQKKKEDLNKTIDKMNEFKEKLKTEKVNWAETKSTWSKLRNKKWTLQRALNGCRQILVHFPIVPLIVPTPIDINS
mgnify:CR=1 FL=1|tara:strand:- start:203 stop:790 length:588 start_codon:yes stop_codon:yes gene_type:complete